MTAAETSELYIIALHYHNIEKQLYLVVVAEVEGSKLPQQSQSTIYSIGQRSMDWPNILRECDRDVQELWVQPNCQVRA